ncbi:hypothetical protein D1816_02375 [Aquimarina sp. AD10]|uniref:hypothetical protein n=1 Tax=Aquimarina sp. AD10 TaxID=1714849 RepID=UPI000E4CBC7B|nr:hypothetical protein [Aquimarina sp. AD10]AXT59240.1 hypothetical protein D1816_02375 [Aquimarina sp. AD10]
MNKYYIIIPFISILFSCKQSGNIQSQFNQISNNIKLTKNENRAIDEILNFYGGNCEYTGGFLTSDGKINKKFIELKISKSDKLYQLEDKLEVPASNIAYRFYNNLKDEKKSYGKIDVAFITTDSYKESYSFDIKTLDSIHKKAVLVNKIIDSMKVSKYDFIESLLSNERYGKSKRKLINDLKRMDSIYGKISSFNSFGYDTYKTENQMNIIHISGFVRRGEQNHALSLYFDFQSETSEILKLQGEL